MKSYCKNLAITREMVADAYDAWRRGSSGRRNWWRVAVEHGCADALVDEIWDELRRRGLRLTPIRRYRHTEPTNGKVRVIGVESVKQQVCDYLAVECLTPMLEAKLGFYQCAGVAGKGQRLCRTALRKWSREGGYFVKADIRQCYPSLSPEVVMGILRRHVRSEDVIYLCGALLATYDAGGMEIGSYLSLCLVNLALSFAYHHVEGLAKERRGRRARLVRHQIWHLDDVLLTGRDKRDLKIAVRSLDRCLRRELGLALKPWKVARLGGAERLDLGGWVAIDGRVTLREGTFLRGTRAFRRFDARPSPRSARRACSYWGWFSHADLERCVRARGMHRTMSRARRMVRNHDGTEARS